MISFQEFESKILSEAIASGGFGENVELVRLVKDSNTGKDQFASDILFVDVEAKVENVEKKFSLLCKFQCESAIRREKFNLHFQFFNEVLVYKELVPLLQENIGDILPKFYYGKATLQQSPKDDVIILENLLPQGYRHSTEKLLLDYDHCSLALKTLGKFHGASLLLKSKLQLKFANIVSKLTETRWLKKLEQENNYFFGENAKRGVIPLVRKGEHLDVVNALLDKLDNVHDMMEDILEVNSYSLLCHGDFCRNNMVFKYENDKPVHTKVFDLATARYASPVVDISFFLFMNTSSELRRKYLKDLLNVYLEALHSVAGDKALSMDELLKEFKEKAVYGYINTAFFIPIMMDPTFSVEVALDKLTMEERVKANLLRGGQKVTDILTENVKDLISWGYLQ